MDVGGTFTDRAALADDGRVVAHKVLSTPSDQGEGVVRSLDGLGTRAAAIVHGTTVVTNLLLERRGARVVLITTAGAEDVLFLRRQDRAALYDLSRHHPAPLIAREDVIGVNQRLVVQRPPQVAAHTRDKAAGASRLITERGLDDREIARVTAAALARDPEIVLVALLHSYADGSHERAIAQALLAQRPQLQVVTSADVLPEIREYERFATASAEAYARPAVIRYLDGLAARLEAANQPAPSVMTSSGGMQGAATAARHAAALALSGPAGGVVGAAAFLAGRADAIHTRDALTIDIGGTSADAGLILHGEPLVEPGGDVAGVPIALPRVLVETVSAGGGSIAWVDDGGALRVGPRSAGARPGPVAFGRGGSEPTVTDAQVVLGRIAAREMSGGVRVDREAAHAAIARLAARLGTDVPSTAAAIVRIADAEMARALRRVSVERGVDPRRCALVAFGGGGPLHCCALADALAMAHIIVPPFAGVLSAVGLALAPERRDSACSVMLPCAELSAARLSELLAVLERGSAGSWRRSFARMRFVGQGHELEVPVSAGDDGNLLAARFVAAHSARYGYALPDEAEVVALRHEAGEPARRAVFRRDDSAAPFDATQLVDHGGRVNVESVIGPATIVLPDATLFVAEGWTAQPWPRGGWVLERPDAELAARFAGKPPLLGDA